MYTVQFGEVSGLSSFKKFLNRILSAGVFYFEPPCRPEVIILSVSKTVTANIVCIRIAGDTYLLIAITRHKISISSTKFLCTHTAEDAQHSVTYTKPSKTYQPLRPICPGCPCTYAVYKFQPSSIQLNGVGEYLKYKYLKY